MLVLIARNAEYIAYVNRVKAELENWGMSKDELKQRIEGHTRRSATFCQSMKQTMPRLIHASFWLHLLIETPAALNFFINPSQQLQLSIASPAAEAVIRQYAILLFSSNLIALIFAIRPDDKTSRRVAGALGLYHLGPALRAISRLVNGETALGAGLGGPVVHLGVHVLCFIALFISWISPRSGKGK